MNARVQNISQQTHATPKLGRNQFEYHWNALEDEPVICHLEYEPAEGDGWNEPYFPSSVTLGHAFVGGVDIYNLLHAKQVERIEELAAIEFDEAMRERVYDQAEARYE